MNHSIARVFLLLFLSLTALCMSARASDRFYTPPEGDPAMLGSIVGSVPEGDAKSAKLKVYVFSIDGKEVAKGDRVWDTPIFLTPGRHVVAVARDKVYEVFEIDVCERCSYEAKAAYELVKKTMMMKVERTEVWIERQPSGELVTERKLATKPIPRDETIYIFLP